MDKEFKEFKEGLRDDGVYDAYRVAAEELGLSTKEIDPWGHLTTPVPQGIRGEDVGHRCLRTPCHG
jgi:hypothetical protein